MRLKDFTGVTPKWLEERGKTGAEQLEAQNQWAKGQANHRSNNQLRLLNDEGLPTQFAVRATYRKDGIWHRTEIVDLAFE